MIDMEKFPALKSLNRFIITFFFVMGVTFNMVAPFSIVNAEEATYLNISANECVQIYNTGEYIVFSENVRLTYVDNDRDLSNNSGAIAYFICDKPVYYGSGSSSCPTASRTPRSFIFNNVTYYYYQISGIGMNWYKPEYLCKINPHTHGQFYEDAAYYTYGEGAVGETVLPDYGEIKDLSYSTNIVGSGTTTGDANIDTISWYPYWDSNDNISTTWNMEIQVVPGTWQGGTNTDIFSQSYQDFIINDSGAMSIYHGTYLNGSYSISWGEVKNKLSILSWADLFQYFDGTYWNKKGWVYRARFNDPDNDYWSEWQIVYTVTSSAGEGVETFIDPSDGTGLPDFYNNAVDSYNTTSIVNNNNNITYYYVNTPVDTNPSSDDSTQYLKEIRDTIIQIRRMIAIDNNSDTNINNDNDPWIGNPAAELYDFEDNSINDFNDAVGDLPTSDLITGNKFLAASTWVRTQYETLVSNTPFEAVIIFSLLLGFGLLLIGKLR